MSVTTASRAPARAPDAGGGVGLYLAHFGLDELPFSLTPNTAFYCDLPVHREAVNVLTVALDAGEGFIKVIGEVGTGKTLLCRKLLSNLADQGYAHAYIPNPYLTAKELRLALAEELGLGISHRANQQRLTSAIHRRLVELNADGRPAVLVVDEAQAMPDDGLEALRLFTNLETERSKLLQVVLFSQPELDRRLAQPHLRQLRQRIAFSYRLGPLDREALATYVQHRLFVAGYNGPPVFGPRALAALHRYSRGIPRLVNVLAHKTLLLAYGRGGRRARARDVRRAAFDTDDVAAGQRLRRGLHWAIGGTIGVAALAAGWGALGWLEVL